MAVANAASDPRLATDIANAVGYMPQSVLCVPLYYADRIIGVIELLDKRDRPSFDTHDMEALTLFANQAAVAVQQSRTHQSLGALVTEILSSVTDAETRYFPEDGEADSSFHDSLDLAKLVHEIANQGERELAACRALLESFAAYLRQRPGADAELSCW
jgi:transcriptional regulator with GAF, ATPase, and Fis domain